MNLEETKKIIENKIEAEALTHNVRSQIKSYIDQKQNVREGFKETFQPLIASQDAVKASIDSQQNRLIEQLRENQLALTEGLNKNRLAITSGFDKMDEVKRSDLLQLPGFEAIEHPEKEIEKEYSQEEPLYLISINDIKLLLGGEESDFTQEDEKLSSISKEGLDDLIKENKLNDKYKLKLIDPVNGIYKVVKKNSQELQKGVVIFDDADLDRGLLKSETANILNKLKLTFPSKIKNEKVVKLCQNNAEVHLDFFRDLLKNKAVFLHRKRSK